MATAFARFVDAEEARVRHDPEEARDRRRPRRARSFRRARIHGWCSPVSCSLGSLRWFGRWRSAASSAGASSAGAAPLALVADWRRRCICFWPSAPDSSSPPRCCSGARRAPSTIVILYATPWRRWRFRWRRTCCLPECCSCRCHEHAGAAPRAGSRTR